MTKQCTMLFLVVFALTLTAAAQTESARVRAIYESSATIPTNVDGIRTYPDPPPGFNPLTASDEELASYGFPPRPDKAEDPHGYDVWVRVMSTPVKRWHGEIKTRKSRSSPATGRISGPQGLTTESGPSAWQNISWSGVVNTIPGTTFSTKTSFCCVAADLVVPQPQQAFDGQGGNICDGDTDQAAFWVGMGGFPGVLGNQNTIAQAGVDILANCGNSNGGAFAWVEWLPAAEDELFNVSAGDDIYVSVDVTSSTSGLFNVIDKTAQVGTALYLNAPVSTVCPGPGGQCELPGNDAEYIVERPAGDSNTPYHLYPLANYIWSFWDFARSKTFSKKYYYPGTASSRTYVLTMWDDYQTQPISVPTVGGTLGLEGMFVQDENCAQNGGCTP